MTRRDKTQTQVIMLGNDINITRKGASPTAFLMVKTFGQGNFSGQVLISYGSEDD